MNKKLLCLFLALCMALSLAACGEKELTTADFEGTWHATADISEEITGSFSQEELSEAFGAGDVSPYINIADLKIPPLTVVLQLNADGTFTMIMDEESKKPIADAVVAWMSGADLEGLFTEVLTAQCEEIGVTLEDMLTVMEADSVIDMMEMALEMPMDEYMTTLGDAICEGLDEELDLSEYSESGTWEYRSGKVVLTTANAVEELAFDKNAFTLTESGNGNRGDFVFHRA